jgi:hypothetical protein
LNICQEIFQRRNTETTIYDNFYQIFVHYILSFPSNNEASSRRNVKEKVKELLLLISIPTFLSSKTTKKKVIRLLEIKQDQSKNVFFS